MIRKLHAALARAIGYKTQPAGFDRAHYTLTRLDALQWAHCYRAATVTRWGRFVASTTTSHGA